MGFPIVIAVLALSGWSIYRIFRHLRLKQVTRAWWAAFTLLAIVGVAIGSWLTFRFEYQVSPTMRCLSFPVPLAFFHLENGQWIDFITPPYIRYPGVAANITAAVAGALAPLFLASALFQTRIGEGAAPDAQC
jgi:hypothetical protein